MKKITDETLKFNIVVNGNEGQKQLGKLETIQRNLTQANKDLRNEKAKLIAQGKKETQAYKRVTDAIKTNVAQLVKNKGQQDKLRKSIGLTGLTFNQLSQEARKLATQLKNMTPDTDEWKKLNNQLLKVKGRMNDVKGAAGRTKSILSSGLGLFGVTSGALLFTDALKGAFRFLKNFTKESVQLAREAKGVEFAFEKIENAADILQRTREQTRGLLSDLDIKKAANEFNNFGLDIEKIPDLLEFVSVTAAQTGKSVDILRDSLVEGLSKESKLRIDNLGISAGELNAQLAKTPNFVEAVAIIAKKKVKEAGNILDEAANSTEQWSATLQNAQVAIGKLINSDSGLGRITRGFISMAQSVVKAIDPTKKLSEELRDQKAEFNILLRAIQNTNKGSKARNKLIAEAQSKYPDFLKNVDLEKTSYEDIERILENVNKQFARRIILAQQEELFTEIVEKQVDNLKKEIEVRKRLEEAKEKSRGREKKSLPIVLKRLQQQKEALEGEFKDAVKQQEELVKRFGFSDALGSGEGGEGGDTETKTRSVTTINEDISKLESKQEGSENQEQYLDFQRQINELLRERQSITGEELDSDKDAQKQVDKEKKEAERKLKARQDLFKQLDDLEAERNIQEEILKLDEEDRDEEEEILEKERDFEKLIAEAQGDKELVAAFEEEKQAQLQLIRDQYEDERAQKDAENKDKQLKKDKKYKEKILKAEQKLKAAREKALSEGLSALSNFADKSSAIGKVLFLVEKALTIGKIIQTTSAAILAAKANDTAVPVIKPGLIGGPNVEKPISSTATTKSIAALKLTAGTQIAAVAATTLKGFEDGLYPVTRTDGKTFNSSFGGAPTTQIVSRPKVFDTNFLAGETKPEMIIDGDTFKKMDPQLTNYILALAGRPVPKLQGFEQGAYPQPKSAEQAPQDNTDMLAMMTRMSEVFENISENGIEAYTNIGEREIRKIDEENKNIKAQRNTAKIN